MNTNNTALPVYIADKNMHSNVVRVFGLSNEEADEHMRSRGDAFDILNNSDNSDIAMLDF